MRRKITYITARNNSPHLKLLKYLTQETRCSCFVDLGHVIHIFSLTMKSRISKVISKIQTDPTIWYVLLQITIFHRLCHFRSTPTAVFEEYTSRTDFTQRTNYQQNSSSIYLSRIKGELNRSDIVVDHIYPLLSNLLNSLEHLWKSPEDMYIRIALPSLTACHHF